MPREIRKPASVNRRRLLELEQRADVKKAGCRCRHSVFGRLRTDYGMLFEDIFFFRAVIVVVDRDQKVRAGGKGQQVADVTAVIAVEGH